MRQRAIAIVVMLSLAALLTVLALSVATKPNADVNLGDDTFNVGNASALARRIRADDFPLLFQDLRDKSIDVFVSHEGRSSRTGWRAIEAHAPGAPRTCQLEWTGSGYIDPCDGTRFPADGAGLRRFEVTVIQNRVIVNFRVQV
ncbi:MAG: hypothetical protein QOF21_796 [Actinomycetota bacterium]|jgi:hypothetical protein